MVELSVILPAYNEAALIASSLARLTAYLDEPNSPLAAWRSWEVILVDDGSSDGTGAAALAVSARESRVKPYTLSRNTGKGGAIRSGVERASGSLLVVTDADLSYALEDIGRTVSALKGDAAGNGYDMVTGDWRHPDSRVELPASAAARRLGRRQVVSRLFNDVARRVFGLAWRDTQCGLKGFRRDAARAITARLRTRGFLSDIEMFIIAGRLGLRIGTIPVHLTYLSDASTVNVARLLPRVLADAARIRLGQMTGRYDRP